MRWNVKNKNYFGPYVSLLQDRYGKIKIGPIMAQVLINRQYPYDNIKKLMLYPGKCLEKPDLIAGCVETGDAIIDIIHSNTKVWIFADYDVDGLTAGYVMYRYLKKHNVNVDVYYPERKEGYGLNVNFLKSLKEKCVVITVDNGVSAIDGIHYCREHNIPLIITDHHTPLVKLKDLTVCDPHLKTNGAGRHLCGAAVAWKICQYIDKKLGCDEAWKLTPYVALGTIADVMPMTLENMAIVKTGLDLINKGFAPNIKQYLKTLGINNPTVEDIAWKLAPALNACGRLGHVHLAKEFLYCNNTSQVSVLISEIENLNKNRKTITNDAVKVAMQQDYGNYPFCMFDATEFPPGISGIIAGKLVEAFNKPAIVYNRKEGCVWPGSVRTNGFDILPYLDLEKAKGNIYDYGGHAQACGIFLTPDLTTFKNSLSGHLRVPVEEYNKTEKVLDIDMEISLSDVTKKLYDDISQIPSDKSIFTQPKFIVKNLQVHEVYHSPNNYNNIRFTLVDKDKNLYKLWAWNKSQLYDTLGQPSCIDIAGTIGRGFGNEAENAVFNVEDIKCCNS